ncbi:MAG: SIMPL domain-containing protein [Saprospiraceae bacterium]|nr:SIMPL domain-containing protein [Saprospiraceae bacterium]
MLQSPAQITVEGCGRVSATPDQVTLSFQIVESSLEYTPCLQGLADRVHQLRADLITEALDIAELRTGHFSVQPRYEFHDGKQTFKGYDARQHLSISIPFNKEKLGQVLQILSQSESKAEFQLNFGLADEQKQRDEALEKAVQQARRDASILAQAAGTQLGELKEIRYGSAPGHHEGGLQVRMAAMKENVPLEVDPSDIQVEARITGTWTILQA